MPTCWPWLRVRAAESAISLQYAMPTFLLRGNIRAAQSATYLQYAMPTFLLRGNIRAAQSATSLQYAMLAFLIRWDMRHRSHRSMICQIEAICKICALSFRLKFLSGFSHICRKFWTFLKNRPYQKINNDVKYAPIHPNAQCMTRNEAQSIIEIVKL